MRFAWRFGPANTLGIRSKTHLGSWVALACGLQWFIFVAAGHAQTAAYAWSFEGDQSGAHLGFSVCSAGDVNGDGHSDVLIGAPDNDNGQSDEGAAYLFLGSPSGLSHAPGWTQEGDQPGARFGHSVASAGDVNGDGYSDVLVGTPGYEDGQSGEGAVFLYLGSPGGLSSVPARLWQGNQAGARFGSSVTGAGDVNSDGFDDVLIGVPGFDGGQSDEGAAFLFLGAASDLPSAPAWSAEGNQLGASFGSSVAALGDVNGDGFGDVVIGAPLYDGGQIEEGQVQIFGGTLTGLGASPLQSLESNVAGTQFGFSVAGGGDLNGGGVRRILYGAPTYTYTHQEEGGTFLSTLGQSHFFLDFGRQDFAHRGASIASAGDVNADGMMDVVIGADLFDAGEEDEGRVTVHLGHSGFIVDRAAAWVIDGNQPYSAFGSSVSSAGDVNGDGYGDVVVGAPLFDRGQSDEGCAFVFLGPTGIVTGVEDESPAAGPSRIRVFPSPSSEIAFIHGDRVTSQGILEAHLYDLQGRLIHVHTIGQASQGVVRASISTKDLPTGVYFVKLMGENGAAVGPARRLVVIR